MPLGCTGWGSGTRRGMRRLTGRPSRRGKRTKMAGAGSDYTAAELIGQRVVCVWGPPSIYGRRARVLGHNDHYPQLVDIVWEDGSAGPKNGLSPSRFKPDGNFA